MREMEVSAAIAVRPTIELIIIFLLPSMLFHSHNFLKEMGSHMDGTISPRAKVRVKAKAEVEVKVRAKVKAKVEAKVTTAKANGASGTNPGILKEEARVAKEARQSALTPLPLKSGIALMDALQEFAGNGLPPVNVLEETFAGSSTLPSRR